MTLSPMSVVTDWCDDNGIAYELATTNSLVAVLPGEQKLRTPVSWAFAANSVTVNAFVMRHPDEHEAEIHKLLLQRNLKIFGMGYAIDHFGDIFLVATLPPAAITTDAVDALMGAVLLHVDGMFNQLVELGFTSAIAAEWRWRLERNENTQNLAAFNHLAPADLINPDKN